MPGYDTHYLFGIKAYKKLPDSKIKEAIKKSGKFLPWQVVTISIDGKKL